MNTGRCKWCGQPFKAIHIAVCTFRGENRDAEEHFCDQICATHGLIHFFDMMLAEAAGASKPTPRRRPGD